MFIRTQFTEIPAFRARWTNITPVAWLRAAISRIRQRRVLAELDDRTLRDIGVSRSEVYHEANKPCWRR
jgi:uncharacterized protein YjiS (DUF1127 family)